MVCVVFFNCRQELIQSEVYIVDVSAYNIQFIRTALRYANRLLVHSDSILLEFRCALSSVISPSEQATRHSG